MTWVLVWGHTGALSCLVLKHLQSIRKSSREATLCSEAKPGNRLRFLDAPPLQEATHFDYRVTTSFLFLIKISVLEKEPFMG